MHDRLRSGHGALDAVLAEDWLPMPSSLTWDCPANADKSQPGLPPAISPGPRV